MSKKFKPTEEQLRAVLASRGLDVHETNEVLEQLRSDSPIPEWVKILLKTIVYALGLILAGYGTATAATLFY